MVSSKGKPTDPKLREEAVEDVKQMTNKDGSGKGQMAAWKASKISKEYEARGGDYENEAGSKNEPSKGAPKAKSDDKKTTETKAVVSPEKKDDKAKSEKEDNKPKANSTKKAEPKAKAPKKEKKAPTEGTRKSSRVAASGQKRSAPEAKEAGGSKKAKK